MNTETKQTKTKRKLSDIDFSAEGSHIALVSKEQGGCASGANYKLVMKANKFSEEFVQKVQQIQVTMELPDFLEKFFYIWGEDAKALAYLMGYVEPADTQAMEAEEATNAFQSWVKDRVGSFEILKALKDNISELANLDENQFLEVRKAQAELEKVLQKDSATADEGSTEAVAKAKESGENQAKVEPSGENKTGSIMANSAQMVEKSAFDTIQKSLNDTKIELQKALDTLAALEAEKKEAIRKSKLDILKSAVQEDKHVEALSKAALSLDATEFDAFIATVKELANKVDNSDLFVEKGLTSAEDKVTESAVAKALKAQNIVK